MSEIQAHIWAAALIRRAQLGGAFAYVTCKGDAEAGVIWVKVVKSRDDVQLYSPERNSEGVRHWRMRLSGIEAESDSAIGKELSFNPDLWVIEIEDRDGRHFITDPVMQDLP